MGLDIPASVECEWESKIWSLISTECLWNKHSRDRFVWHNPTVVLLIYPCVKPDSSFYKVSIFQVIWSSVLLSLFWQKGSLSFCSLCQFYKTKIISDSEALSRCIQIFILLERETWSVSSSIKKCAGSLKCSRFGFSYVLILGNLGQVWILKAWSSM